MCSSKVEDIKASKDWPSPIWWKPERCSTSSV